MAMRSKWTKTQFADDESDSECEWDDESPVVLDSTHDEDDEDWPWIAAIQHKEQIETIPNGVPVEIIPGKLYIGDADSVKEGYKENLRERRITAVLNMAANKGTPADPSYVASEWKEGMKDGSFLYKDIQADDDKKYPLIEKHWDEAEKFISNAISQNRPCLVHCVQGQNRSGLIVCAFYMVYKQIDIVAAVEHVRSKRGTEVLNNSGFQRQLVELARRENLLGCGRDGSALPVPVSPEQEEAA